MSISISIDPNPVPWTNVAVESCTSDTPNRWIWRQILVNNGSTAVMMSQRLNFFNGTSTGPPATDTTTLSPGERYERTTRWCSGLGGSHTFRTDWVTSTGVRLTGPTVQLAAP